jgi:hypothetical protein
VNGVSSDPVSFHEFECYILHFILPGFLPVSQDNTKVKKISHIAININSAPTFFLLRGKED